MQKFKLHSSAVLAAILLLAAVFLRCSGKQDDKVINKKMKLSPVCRGVNELSLNYWIDSTTMICYATSGPHGFTCVPCDSLKRLSNSR